MIRRAEPPAAVAVPNVRQSWSFPRPVYRFGERLVDQQLWCWGRDIVRPDGNLLLAYGFDRCRSHDIKPRGCTCYRLDSPRFHIAVWGFGIFYGQPRLGGLFLSRAGFCPRWCNLESLPSNIHKPCDLPLLKRPQSKEELENAKTLSNEMFSWIGSYERWILWTAGCKYRQHCIDSGQRPIVCAEAVHLAWKLMGSQSWEGDPDGWISAMEKLRY